jgi:hypothetical protein
LTSGGIHFPLVILNLPESSHLSHAFAIVFTDAYIRSVAQLTPLLRLKPDAPPPLSRPLTAFHHSRLAWINRAGKEIGSEKSVCRK